MPSEKSIPSRVKRWIPSREEIFHFEVFATVRTSNEKLCDSLKTTWGNYHETPIVKVPRSLRQLKYIGTPFLFTLSSLFLLWKCTVRHLRFSRFFHIFPSFLAISLVMLVPYEWRFLDQHDIWWSIDKSTYH